MGGGGGGGGHVGGLGGGGSFAGGNNGNGIGLHARAASNGGEDFSDFQGSTPGAGGGGKAPGVTNGGTPVAAAAAGSGVTNPKWRDVSSLVDLGGLSSNTDNKVRLLLLSCRR